MGFNTLLSAFAEGFNPDSWVMYLMYGLIVGFVSAEAIYYLVKSIRRAKHLNMDMAKIKKVITTSASFSVLPAVGIGIGVVTLVGAIGIALPSIRLSVIGALQYETQMADVTAEALSTQDGIKGSMSALMQNGISARDYVTIATIMTLAILWGCVLVVLFYKRLQPKITKLGMTDLSATKNGNKFLNEKKVNIGDLCFQVAFIGMIIGYLAMAISTVFGTTKYVYEDQTVFEFTNMFYTYGYYNLIAVIVAAISMVIFDALINKVGWKWLDSFSTAFSMIFAMVVVAVIAYFAQQNGWDPTFYDTAPATSNAIIALI